MSITKRQFSHLKAMGIELWQLKDNVNEIENDAVDFISIELSEFIETNLFTDILNSLGYCVDEVVCENNALSLGLLTWKFSHKSEISLTKHHLVTPTINVLIKSSQLKRALWQKLQEYTQK